MKTECIERPEYLFCANDGALYDTRDSNWHARPPLRAVYYGLKRDIPKGTAGAAALKACLRHGANWNYVSFFIAADGEALSFAAVRENFSRVLDSVLQGDSDGWRVVGTSHSGESEGEIRCAHSGEIICGEGEES